MSKIAVVYWSGTGNTEAMAAAVAEGAQATGAEAELFTAAEFSPEQLQALAQWRLAAPLWGRSNWRKASLSPCFRLARPV